MNEGTLSDRGRTMAISEAPLPYGKKGDETRRRIKRAAMQLFAREGVDRVTVRDIVVAAGQRNVGSLNYYFGTKEALLREVLIDGVGIIDGRYSQMLDELESSGGPRTLREVIEILVRGSVDMDREGDEDHSFIRFCLRVSISDRALFFEETSGKLDIGHRRCVAHIRRLVAPVSNDLFAHRINCMMNMLTICLSIREMAYEAPGPLFQQRDSYFRNWVTPAALENLVDAMEGVVRQPFSPAALALVKKEEG